MSEENLKTSESRSGQPRGQKSGQKNGQRNGQRNPRGFAQRLLIGISSAICILMYQNCGTDFVPLDEKALSGLGKFVCGSTLQESFGRSYHQFAVSNCASCHGAAQSPKFALADTALAFAEFNKTTQETFKAYATNPGHGSGAAGPKHADAIEGIESGYNVCKGGGGGGGTPVVMARTRPLVLNAAAALALRSYTALDTDLELGSTNLGGARFHFQVRVDTSINPPAYVIARPSLQTGTSTVRVKSIGIRINGSPVSAATAFMGLDRTINPNTNPLAGQVPNGNLSLGSAIFEYPGAVPATDTVQFEFEILQSQ